METVPLAYAALIALILLNGYASYRAVKSEFAEYQQKVLQLVLLWLLPIVGALLVIHFSRDMDRRADYKTPDASPGQNIQPTGGDGAGGE